MTSAQVVSLSSPDTIAVFYINQASDFKSQIRVNQMGYLEVGFLLVSIPMMENTNDISPSCVVDFS